ncbi:MAG TPA: response regulator transcription factor [Actinobacteria bacterium]|nr:response regulator transcription factor [Actinomycetota bacterium]
MADLKKILVVEDEKKISEVIKAYLEREGYLVNTTPSGREALKLAETVEPDLVVLDLMLPDLSGEEVCATLRRRSDVPIIMVTAKTAEDDRVHGLDIGADDYLTKPFSPRELVARVKSILRRTHSEEEFLAEKISFNDERLVIDITRHEVRVDGQVVALTPHEFKLLSTLSRHPGRVYSRYELINRVQGYDYEGYERTIDAHVKNLRQKIEREPKEPMYIKTVFGVGYRFEDK